MYKYSTITCKLDTKIEQSKQGTYFLCTYFLFNITKHLSDIKKKNVYIYICHNKKDKL